MINKVILVGRLTHDPQLKATPQGLHIATLRMVTNSYIGKDEEGKRKEAPEYHELVMFGRQAEVAADFLRKGRLLYAEGRLQTRSYEVEGQKKYRTEVVVETFQILSPKPAESEAA
jgi:single-strand DNA-binding protein